MMLAVTAGTVCGGALFAAESMTMPRTTPAPTVAAIVIPRVRNCATKKVLFHNPEPRPRQAKGRWLRHQPISVGSSSLSNLTALIVDAGAYLSSHDVNVTVGSIAGAGTSAGSGNSRSSKNRRAASAKSGSMWYSSHGTANIMWRKFSQ